MRNPEINVVWLKRDLRTQDHLPLHQAEQAGLPYLILYLFEPDLMAYPDTSLRHLQFVYHSLLSLNETLAPYQRQVEVCYGEATTVFAALLQQFRVRQVFSYQESGIRLTWDRDKQVQKLLREHRVNWQESQRDGVIRGLRHRDGWNLRWLQQMQSPLIHNTYSPHTLPPWAHEFPLPDQLLAELLPYPAHFQPPGEANAGRYLRSFLQERGANYHRLISKPTASRTACSRLSPYLAWGNLSIRQAYQAALPFKAHRAYGAFLSRLIWHCHFIQKFEVECDYESRCINRGYELLERPQRWDWLRAWKDGQTGFPLVDAAMRCVKATGWINFRLRAMVVSFLCHHLDQDWRQGVYYLAQQFLDYEPGIHYPQFQMQAGTTGVNTIRMYNPSKQARDHDPKGIFIRKWLPELAPVPDSHLPEPWKMTQMEQLFCGVMIGQDYPAPLVDLEESGRKARRKLWDHRHHPLVKQENQRILETHTDRNNISQR